jgi:hypothetical protein
MARVSRLRWYASWKAFGGDERERPEQATTIEPAHPLDRRVLDGVDVAPGPAAPDHRGLVEGSPSRRVLCRTSRRRFPGPLVAGFGEPLRVSEWTRTHTSEDYRRALAAHGLTRRMNRKGNVHDNAATEEIKRRISASVSVGGRPP